MGATGVHTIKQKGNILAQRSTVSVLVKQLMGTKSVTMFCDDVGLSRGYVSKLLNNKLKSKPSVRTLAKIAYSRGDDAEETFSILLKTCGYFDIDDKQKKEEIRIARREARVKELRRKNIEIEMYEDVELKASAVGLLFSKFLLMGISVNPIGSFNPDESIEFGIKGYDFERIIAIPAFCGNTNQEVMAERDVLRRLIKSLCIKRPHSLLYLVMTDSADVFDYISSLIKEMGNIFAYVLRADIKGTKFIDQKFFSKNDNVKEDIFKFVD